MNDIPIKLSIYENDGRLIALKYPKAGNDIAFALKNKDDISNQIETILREKYGDLDFCYLYERFKRLHDPSFWFHLATLYDFKSKLSNDVLDFLSYEIEFGNFSKQTVIDIIKKVELGDYDNFWIMIQSDEFKKEDISIDLIEKIINNNQNQVLSYRNNPKIIGWFVGQYLKESKADPKLVKEKFEEILDAP